MIRITAKDQWLSKCIIKLGLMTGMQDFFLPNIPLETKHFHIKLKERYYCEDYCIKKKKRSWGSEKLSKWIRPHSPVQNIPMKSTFWIWFPCSLQNATLSGEVREKQLVFLTVGNVEGLPLYLLVEPLEYDIK